MSKTLSSRSASPNRLVVCLGLALALIGCGGGGSAFGDTFPDNHGEHLTLVLNRLEAQRARATSVRRESAIAITVSAAPSRLSAFDLTAGTSLWESGVELRSVPQLAGRSVITHEGSEIVVRDLRTGRVTSRIADRSLNLVGGSGEGADAAFTLSTGGGVGAFSVVQGLHDGAPTISAQMSQAFGAPAVTAGMVFVPWGHQNMSVLDLSTGAEIARLRSADGVIASALAHDGNVFFGQSGVALLSQEIATGTSPTFASLTQPMPANPQLLRDAYQPPQGPNSAQNRVRLAYRPVVEAGQAGFEGETVYLVFYRLIFALTEDGALASWVASIPRDAVGAQVVDGGLVVIDEAGGAHLLSSDDGREVWSAQLGSGIVYASVAAEGLTGGEPRGDAMPLRDQLLTAAQNTDGRLVPLRELAVRLLAAMPEPDVTANVIAVCDDRAVTASVRAAACEALGTRTLGNDHVIAALERHAAFLRDVRSPPVGALARASVAMGERRAIPLLVGHLRDPETAAADIAPLAESLASFGDESAAAPLADFIRFYHAESADSGLEPGLTAALLAYRTLAGPTSRELLEEIAADAIALESVRNAARAQLTALEAPAATEGTTGTDPTTDPGEMTITEADDTRPAAVTNAMLLELYDAHVPALERCLVTPERVFQHARVVLVVDPQGQVLMVTTNPPSLNACIEPIVRGVTYPASRARGRQHLTYEIHR